MLQLFYVLHPCMLTNPSNIFNFIFNQQTYFKAIKRKERLIRFSQIYTISFALSSYLVCKVSFWFCFPFLKNFFQSAIPLEHICCHRIVLLFILFFYSASFLKGMFIKYNILDKFFFSFEYIRMLLLAFMGSDKKCSHSNNHSPISSIVWFYNCFQ